MPCLLVGKNQLAEVCVILFLEQKYLTMTQKCKSLSSNTQQLGEQMRSVETIVGLTKLCCYIYIYIYIHLHIALVYLLSTLVADEIFNSLPYCIIYI